MTSLNLVRLETNDSKSDVIPNIGTYTNTYKVMTLLIPTFKAIQDEKGGSLPRY